MIGQPIHKRSPMIERLEREERTEIIIEAILYRFNFGSFTF